MLLTPFRSSTPQFLSYDVAGGVTRKIIKRPLFSSKSRHPGTSGSAPRLRGKISPIICINENLGKSKNSIGSTPNACSDPAQISGARHQNHHMRRGVDQNTHTPDVCAPLPVKVRSQIWTKAFIADLANSIRNSSNDPKTFGSAALASSRDYRRQEGACGCTTGALTR